MKKIKLIIVFAAIAAALMSCNKVEQSNPARVFGGNAEYLLDNSEQIFTVAHSQVERVQCFVKLGDEWSRASDFAYSGQLLVSIRTSNDEIGYILYQTAGKPATSLILTENTKSEPRYLCVRIYAYDNTEAEFYVTQAGKENK